MPVTIVFTRDSTVSDDQFQDLVRFFTASEGPISARALPATVSLGSTTLLVWAEALQRLREARKAHGLDAREVLCCFTGVRNHRNFYVVTDRSPGSVGDIQDPNAVGIDMFVQVGGMDHFGGFAGDDPDGSGMIRWTSPEVRTAASVIG